MIRHLVIKRNAPVTGESPLLKKEEEETRRPREDRSSRSDRDDNSRSETSESPNTETANEQPVTAEVADESSAGEES